MTIPKTKTNGFAIASLVFGIIWLGFLGSILAVICGHVALSEINKSNWTGSPGRQTGKGMAIVGLSLGYLGLALLVVAMVALSVFDPR